MTEPTFPTRTQFICSIGPASASKEVLEGLARAGASYFRLNFAHATYEQYDQWVAWTKEINQKLGTRVRIQSDLQGPNIRVGRFPGGGIQLEVGERVFSTAPDGEREEGDIFVDDFNLHNDVKPGEGFMLADGDFQGTITKVEGKRITVDFINGGYLKDRKSINVPDTILTSPALTEKDYRDLEYILQAGGTDVLAISFVSTRKEIDEVRGRIGDRPIKIMSKVERKEAIKNIVEIVDASDIVQVARGDLGIEVPMEDVPVYQRMMTDLCRNTNGQTAISVATQMMLSMQSNLRPTRAEVSDVAYAVYSGADSLMLSEETTVGIDPVNALSTMVRIARRIEQEVYHRPNTLDIIFPR